MTTENAARVATTPAVETANGKLRGVTDNNGVYVFKGVRYAESTGGGNRFLPPQPVRAWAGVQDALCWAGSAPQHDVAEHTDPFYSWYSEIQPINGTAGHGAEIDGAHVVGGHPGATIVHAAVAIAERQHATGAELLNAVVLGYDVGTRIVAACGGVFGLKSRYHLHSDFLYGVGAAVAGSRLLGLDQLRQCYAMALATFQANGLIALFQEKRHISKSFSNGQYACAGVSAALMSAAGLEGCEDILGGPDGVLEAWGGEDGTQAVSHNLGQDYAVMGANFKFINAGYPIHAPVEAASTLLAEHHIDVAAIESVHVGMPANAMRVVDNRQMHNICVQDMVTAALLRGSLSLSESPFPAILADPAFAHMRVKARGVGRHKGNEQGPDQNPEH